MSLYRAYMSRQLGKKQRKLFPTPNTHSSRNIKPLAFRSKTVDKWSAREVQEVLDEYHLEKCVKSSKREGNRININAAEFSPNNTPVSDTPELKKMLVKTTPLLKD